MKAKNLPRKKPAAKKAKAKKGKLSAGRQLAKALRSKPAKPAPVERKEFVPCRMCDGEGYEGKVPCKACDGTGEVIRTRTRPVDALKPADNGKHPGGASPKHTPEMVELLAEAISRGMTDQQAADLAGIHSDTLREWRKDDAEFSAAIKKATSERLLDRIRFVEGANEGWQSNAWLLERAHGPQFAPPKTVQRVEHSLANGMEDAAVKEAEEMLGLM